MNETTDSSEAGESPVPSVQSLDADRVFDLLSNQRRRFVIHCLQKYENPMALADMADKIAVWENDTGISNVSAEEVKRVYISLYHTHVPKLADADIVEYSQDRDSVTMTDTADEIQSHVDTFSD